MRTKVSKFVINRYDPKEKKFKTQVKVYMTLFVPRLKEKVKTASKKSIR